MSSKKYLLPIFATNEYVITDFFLNKMKKYQKLRELLSTISVMRYFRKMNQLPVPLVRKFP